MMLSKLFFGDLEDDNFWILAIFDYDDLLFYSIGVRRDGIRFFGDMFLSITLPTSLDNLEKSPVGPIETRLLPDDLLLKLDELRFITWVMLVNVLDYECFVV